MFEEVEPPAGSQHPTDLGQRLLDAGNRAEGERRQRAIAGIVVQRDLLAPEPDVMHDHVGVGDAALGQSSCCVGRLDRVHLGDLGRIHRHVQARTESDLDQGAGQPFGDLGSPLLQLGAATGAVDHTREDVLSVQTHPPVFHRGGDP